VVVAQRKPPSSPMAANGFPAGEREGENQKVPVGGIPEPLGDVFLLFGSH